MKTFITLFAFFVFFTTPALAEKNVALVKILKGQAEVLELAGKRALKLDEWIKEGVVIKTSDKSFVRLIFVDKSQVNIGPNSEMKIESFSGKDSGVLDLVKGKIRSQVSKDYLQMEERNKSKLFIKTKNAVMGVRGTDFLISSDGKSSSVVLFEGEVVFNKLENQKILSSSALEKIVDQGVKLYPGEFSVVNLQTEPTIPAILNIQQREAMEKNGNFDSKNSVGSKEKTTKSVVPEGLSGAVVSNDSETLRGKILHDVPKGRAESDPNGFVREDGVKPANGSFLHVDSGIIIPPAPNSILDKNSNTFVSGTGNGRVGEGGEYIPPKDMIIKEDGRLLMTGKDEAGKTVIREIERPNPTRQELIEMTKRPDRIISLGQARDIAPTATERQIQNRIESMRDIQIKTKPVTEPRIEIPPQVPNLPPRETPPVQPKS